MCMHAKNKRTLTLNQKNNTNTIKNGHSAIRNIIMYTCFLTDFSLNMHFPFSVFLFCLYEVSRRSD